jgi:GAF domain-containing protein
LGNLFRIPYVYGVDDPLVAQRARLTLQVSLSLIALSVFGLICLLSVYQPDTGDAITLTGLIVTLAGALIAVGLVRGKMNRLAAVTLVATLTLGITLVLFPYSYNNIGALMLVVPLPLATVLLGRGGLMVTIWGLFAALVISSLVATAKIAAPALLLSGAFNDVQLVPISIILIGGLMLAVNGLVLWFVANEQQMRNRLQRRADQSTQLTLRINRILATYTSRDVLISQIPDEIRDQFGYYYVQIFMLDKDNQLLIRPLRVGSLSAQERAERRIRLDDDQNVIAQLVHSGQSRVIALNSPLADRSEFLNATRQELLVVLRYQGQIWGVLDIHSVQADSFGPRDLEVIENLASQIATALSTLDSKITIQSLGQDRQRLQDQVDRLTHDLDQLRQTANVRAWIGYLSERRQMATGFDWQNGQLQANETMTPSLSHALTDAFPQLRVEGEEQVLNVPISVRGLQLGTIEFRSGDQTIWTESSLELARLIGQRLALILDNVRLVEQSRESELRERLINQVSGRLQAETDLDKLLATAADAFSQALGASSTRIQLTTHDVPLKTLANGKLDYADQADYTQDNLSGNGER